MFTDTGKLQDKFIVRFTAKFWQQRGYKSLLIQINKLLA